jgi:RNA polymerase sigma factor for flagellar operon FliA
MRARRTYDPSKGPLKPYAVRCIESEMRVAARTERRQTCAQRMWQAAAAGRAHQQANSDSRVISAAASRRALLEDAVTAYVLTESARTEPLTPETMLCDDEEREHVKKAVAQLPERLRLVVQMHYFENKPVKEVAKALSVDISRASHLLTDAYRKLQHLLHPAPTP